MHTTIDFPNLGIHLENVGKTLSIGSFDIAFYGMAIGLGIILGLFIAMWNAKRTGQDPETYIDFVIYGVIFGILGARLYYVIFSWDSYKDNLLSIFNIREGGLAIYGGIIAAVITVFVFAKKKKLSALVLLDTACPGLAAGQMIGRWGNFFNREAFGEYTDGLFAMKLPVDAVRSSDITMMMRRNMETVGGVNYIQVHPTFLYESLWCLALVILLLIFVKYKKADGECFLLYLAGYGCGRFWIEGLRTDQLLLPGIGLPVSQLLSLALVIFAIGTMIYIRRKKK